MSWIGNVVVDPALRGRGVGAGLVRAAVARAHARGRRTVALYSVPKAEALYAREGFVTAGRLHAVAAARPPDAPAPAGATRLAPADLDEVAAFDRARVGFDRRALLAQLLASYDGVALRERGRLVGYGFAKAGWESAEIGPVVADGPEAQRAVLDGVLARLDHGPVECGVPADNAAAVAHLRARGFATRFEPAIMFHGPPPPTRWDAVVAVGGLEKG